MDDPTYLVRHNVAEGIHLMSAQLAKAQASALRLRRNFDIDAVTVWVGVMALYAVITAVFLIGH
jgi:hypothetical protein